MSHNISSKASNNLMAPIAQLENSPITSASVSTRGSLSSVVNQPNAYAVHLSERKMSNDKEEPLTMSTVSSNIKYGMNLGTNSVSSISDHEFVTTANERKCLISVWSTWYCLVISILHGYLINLYFIEVLNLFQLQSKSPKIELLANETYLQMYNEILINLNDHLFFELVSRSILLGLSVVFLLFFILASLKSVGNYPNDGVKFGRDFFSEKLVHSHMNEMSVSHSTLNTERLLKKTDRRCFFSITDFLEILWRHFLPISHFCHLISILLLIFSRIIFVNSISQSYDSLSGCFIKSNNSSMPVCLVNYYVDLAKAAQQPAESATTFDNTGFILKQLDLYKFEIASFGLASISIYIRYGAVFWFTNKSLSFLLTFIGLIAAVEQLFQVYSFVYIYHMLNEHELYLLVKQLVKALDYQIPTLTTFSSNNFPQTSTMPLSTVDISSLTNTYDLPLLIRNRLTLLFLYFTLSILVYLSATPAYVFSFLKYKERFLIEESLYIREFRDKDNKITAISHQKRPHKVAKVNNQMIVSTCCFNYCPHLIATIQLVVICVCKLPFCYDYIIYFNKLKDFGIMLVIIIEILHIITLIFIWLLLTLKTDWTMHLQTPFSICHWTYHSRFKANFDEPKKPKSEARNKCVFSDEMEKPYKPEQVQRFENLSDYQQIEKQKVENNNIYGTALNDPSQPAIRRSVVTIRDNTNKSLKFKADGASNYRNQPRDWIDSKHRSLYVKNSDYDTHCESMNPIKPTASDYLLNSETLYRKQIRNSIKNVMQQNQPQPQRQTSNAPNSGITLPIFNESKQNYSAVLEYENPKALADPFFYKSISINKKATHGDNPNKNYSSTIHLSTTPPQIFDSTTNMTKFMTKNLNNQSNSKTVNASAEMNANEKTRSMIYLERPTNLSNEYESRV